MQKTSKNFGVLLQRNKKSLVYNKENEIDNKKKVLEMKTLVEPQKKTEVFLKKSLDLKKMFNMQILREL